jgi:zinc and cadmium transporter
MLIFWIILFSLLGSVGALVTAAAFLLLREKIQKVLIPCLVSYATGTLLAAALLGLIPQALKNTLHIPILSTVLAGIVIFFILEKLVVWRHCHDKKCEIHGIAGPMIARAWCMHAHHLCFGIVWLSLPF